MGKSPEGGGGDTHTERPTLVSLGSDIERARRERRIEILSRLFSLQEGFSRTLLRALRDVEGGGNPADAYVRMLKEMGKWSALVRELANVSEEEWEAFVTSTTFEDPRE